MSLAKKTTAVTTASESVAGSQARAECHAALQALIERTPALLFASVATVDGRSFTHANGKSQDTNPLRCAAIMSSLMGLIESFSRESLKSRALYNSISTEHGSIVIVRIPTQAKHHTLCLCSDASENLAMTIRAALDTASVLAEKIDVRA